MTRYLRLLTPDDVSAAYVDWLHDPEVVRYSDNQYRQFSLEGQRDYVASCLADTGLDLFGIFWQDRHVGNIVIQGLNSPHKRGELTYMIGDRASWGHGLASWAIRQLCDKARNHYGLHKICAGCAGDNIGSQKVLLKNGFSLEGTRPQHLYYGGQWQDQLDFGRLLTS